MKWLSSGSIVLEHWQVQKRLVEEHVVDSVCMNDTVRSLRFIPWNFYWRRRYIQYSNVLWLRRNYEWVRNDWLTFWLNYQNISMMTSRWCCCKHYQVCCVAYKSLNLFPQPYNNFFITTHTHTALKFCMVVINNSSSTFWWKFISHQIDKIYFLLLPSQQKLGFWNDEDNFNFPSQITWQNILRSTWTVPINTLNYSFCLQFLKLDFCWNERKF